MAEKNKSILKKDTAVTRKTFVYDLDGVRIEFTLRIDVKKELKAARLIVDQALKDFDVELYKLDNQHGK